MTSVLMDTFLDCLFVLFINQAFRRKNLIIKMMNVGGRVGVNNSFPEHNSATVRNIVTMLGRIIEQVNTDCRIQE